MSSYEYQTYQIFEAYTIFTKMPQSEGVPYAWCPAALVCYTFILHTTNMHIFYIILDIIKCCIKIYSMLWF